MEIPAVDLILAIVRQAIRDYIRLDPDSDKVSAEFSLPEGEWYDYQTAEDFLFNNIPINFGNAELTFTDICDSLGIDQKRLKFRVARAIIEY